MKNIPGKNGSSLILQRRDLLDRRPDWLCGVEPVIYGVLDLDQPFEIEVMDRIPKIPLHWGDVVVLQDRVYQDLGDPCRDPDPDEAKHLALVCRDPV